MIKPRLILCAKSLSQDKKSNLLSYFHVLESITAVQPEPQEGGFAAEIFRFVGVAIWEASSDHDRDTELNYELTIGFPWEDSPRSITNGCFRMTKRFHRFTTDIGVQTVLPETAFEGDIVFASKVKEADATEWTMQQYQIPLTIERIHPSNTYES